MKVLVLPTITAVTATDDDFLQQLKEGREVGVTIGPKVDPRDRELFFGNNIEVRLHIEDEDVSFPQLLRFLGCFSSAGEARKNGWDKPIPDGFSEHTIGKARKIFLFCLKPRNTWEEDVHETPIEPQP